jgi:hypothetical protein
VWPAAQLIVESRPQFVVHRSAAVGVEGGLFFGGHRSHGFADVWLVPLYDRDGSWLNSRKSYA